MSNKKEIYIETSSGDLYLVEVSEHLGWVSITVGNKTFDLTPDSVFNLADALMMMANDVESCVMEYQI